VQPVLDELSAYYNVSFSFGFADASGQVGLASGVQNVWDGTKMTSTTPIPFGSTTKPWTTVAILQAAESKVLSLDDPATKYLDPIMTRLNSTTLQGLWGAKAAQITIRHLIGMTSGLGDYDDAAISAWTVANSGEDLGPFELLHLANKTFVCDPGECGYYSSIGYVLLGLILTEAHSLYSWQDFDQLSILPSSFRNHYNSTTFPKLGRCTQYPTIAHQYSSYIRQDGSRTVNQIFDLIDDSCLNGWTMGNVASTGGNMASFFYDLFSTVSLPTGQRLVGEASMAEMLNFKPLVNAWCPNCAYGAGIIIPTPGGAAMFPSLPPSRANETVIKGHPGQDWGSGTSPLCGYNAAHKFGICLGYNSAKGMNCSKGYGENLVAWVVASCRVLDAALNASGGPRLNCTIPAPAYPPVPCEWSYDPPAEARLLGRAADGGLIHHQTAWDYLTKIASKKKGA